MVLKRPFFAKKHLILKQNTEFCYMIFISKNTKRNCDYLGLVVDCIVLVAFVLEDLGVLWMVVIVLSLLHHPSIGN